MPAAPSCAPLSPDSRRQQQRQRQKSVPKLNPDGSVRLNARQRRTLRRAQERATKALLEAQTKAHGISSEQVLAGAGEEVVQDRDCAQDTFTSAVTSPAWCIRIYGAFVVEGASNDCYLRLDSSPPLPCRPPTTWPQWAWHPSCWAALPQPLRRRTARRQCLPRTWGLPRCPWPCPPVRPCWRGQRCTRTTAWRSTCSSRWAQAHGLGLAQGFAVKRSSTAAWTDSRLLCLAPVAWCQAAYRLHAALPQAAAVMMQQGVGGYDPYGMAPADMGMPMPLPMQPLHGGLAAPLHASPPPRGAGSRAGPVGYRSPSNGGHRGTPGSGRLSRFAPSDAVAAF